MAVRTITYTVTADGVSPASIQSAGVQNDMNVTELIFDFKALQSGIMISGKELRYRFDCVDGAGGKFSTESNEVDYETFKAEFVIGEALTRYGGNVSVCLVLTRIGKNKQGEDVTEAEMYCHPVNIRLKALPQGHHTDGGDRESITTLAENTKAAAERASISAQRSGEAADNALSASYAAELHARDAEESAQNAKIASAEINKDGMLVIRYYGGDVQVGPVIGPKGDKGDKGEKGDKGDKGADAVTDQKYSPTSPNAQSGIAVEEAVGNKQDKFADVTVDRDGNVLLTPKKDLQIAANNDNGHVALAGKYVALYGDYTNLHGLVSVLGDLDFGYGNGRISNLGEPKSDNDAVNRAYVDNLVKNSGGGGGSIVVDQTYSPTSPNAQSGKAVAQAVAPKMDKFGEVSELYGDQYISNYNGGFVFQTTKASSFIGAPLRVETPDGTDPAQAATVEYVAQHTSKERRMKLIADHTVTAEEASEGKAWELSMSKINNGIPLDKVHIIYDIPNSTTITSNTNISARINGGVDLGSYLNYVYVAKNAYGPFWVEAEKIAENKWRNVRTQINPYINDSTLYANYFLGSVDVINSIIIAGIPFEGINIKVWGRDAI